MACPELLPGAGTWYDYDGRAMVAWRRSETYLSVTARLYIDYPEEGYVLIEEATLAIGSTYKGYRASDFKWSYKFNYRTWETGTILGMTLQPMCRDCVLAKESPYLEVIVP